MSALIAAADIVTQDAVLDIPVTIQENRPNGFTKNDIANDEEHPTALLRLRTAELFNLILSIPGKPILLNAVVS